MAQEQNIVRDIKNIEKRIAKLERVKQLIGADIVQITSSDLVSTSSGSVPAGGRVVFTLTISPSSGILNLWDLFFSFYIDTDDDTDYLYPSGGSLSSGQKNLDLQWSLDFVNSDEDTGERVAKITIVNNDSSSHEYFLHSKWYGIKQEI